MITNEGSEKRSTVFNDFSREIKSTVFNDFSQEKKYLTTTCVYCVGFWSLQGGYFKSVLLFFAAVEALSILMDVVRLVLWSRYILNGIFTILGYTDWLGI